MKENLKPYVCKQSEHFKRDGVPVKNEPGELLHPAEVKQEMSRGRGGKRV